MNAFRLKAKAVRQACMLLCLGVAACTSLHAAPLEDPAAVAERLSQALAQGDEAAVKSLLAEDVLIYEAGGQERSLAEYAAHHLGADIAFMSSVRREVLSRRVIELGEAAVVATRTRLDGQYKGKPVASLSTETLVMARRDGWKIVHIHWSSR